MGDDINPNGILIGENATINVGHLYASTRNITEADLQQFRNQGTLSAIVPTSGDIVNRAGLGLDNMKITLEGYAEG